MTVVILTSLIYTRPYMVLQDVTENSPNSCLEASFISTVESILNNQCSCKNKYKNSNINRTIDDFTFPRFSEPLY